jgi:site-specific DNA-methyltransferase (adenine-specific)|tara:strand:+ start:1541 stop:2596 length:1056 start_codon:yes stop_codon:yes gene_type:complete
MPSYTCEKCLKDFSQKSHYNKHLQRKRPCQDNMNKISMVVEKIVNEKMKNEIVNIETPPPTQSVSNQIIINSNNATNIDIQREDGLQYLKRIEDNSAHLVLTDPPYIISRESGMDTHYNKVKKNEENNILYVKTQEEWNNYKSENSIVDDTKKDNYMKYGTIYGKKYCVKTDYGEWDSKFTMNVLDEFIGEYYKKLKQGGTIIIFFDIWKITLLKELMEKHNFKQIRFIEWIKTNPQPLNSKTNYLTNCREIALLGVKGGKPTFHSKYDKGIYEFPLQGGKNRFHPTQKSLLLFEALIKKHSNENDIVIDTFLGAGTTAFACKNTNRQFKGCEIDKEYFDKAMEIISKKED